MSVNMLKGIHRRMLGISPDDQVMGKNGFVAGGDNAPAIVYPSPDTVAIFEDFLDTGAALEGWHDTGSATHAVVAGTNGIYRMSSFAMTAVTDPSVLTGNLSWKVNQGPGAQSGRLRMSARVKKSAYTGGMHGMFVGFTDVLGAEMPFHDTGGTSDKATATNGFGIMFNTDGDTGWVGVAVDGDTYQETVLEATTPTDNAYVVLEMEAHRGTSDTGGTVTFYIDGIPKGSIDNPCNTSTALAPSIAAYDTGAASNVDVDWVNVSAPRDTGA